MHIHRHVVVMIFFCCFNCPTTDNNGLNFTFVYEITFSRVQPRMLMDRVFHWRLCRLYGQSSVTDASPGFIIISAGCVSSGTTPIEAGCWTRISPSPTPPRSSVADRCHGSENDQDHQQHTQLASRHFRRSVSANDIATARIAFSQLPNIYTEMGIS